jgi:TetR/AcrR family transcriptional regulator of autoinduction and epiphytic fitness
MSIFHFMTEDKRQRLLTVALDVFFKHGYKRVEMKEIAEVAGISRPGLYLYFKTKQEIFSAAILQYAETKILEITENIDSKKTLEEKLRYAFEIWCVRGFDRSLKSPEAKEVSDCSLEFAREALDESYQKLEKILVRVLKAHSPPKKLPSPAKTAHLLVGATRGFKVVSRSSAELRTMIHELLIAVL